MKALFLSLLLFFSAGAFLQAQQTGTDLSPKSPSWLEGGFLIGTTAYGGDLRSNDAIFLDQPGFALGAALRYNFTPAWAVRADVLYNRLRADDANDDDINRQRRGYSFNSGVFELAVRGEWHPLAGRRYRNGTFQKIWSPYLFGGAGLALISTNPDFNGDTERPGLAADRNSSENSTLVLPFGLGLRIDLSEDTAFGIEYGFRASRTDYLDGVSQAGNPDQNDRYAVATLQFWKRFGSK